MKCFVPSCATDFCKMPGGVSKHFFPKNKLRQVEWLQAIAKAENCHPEDLKAVNFSSDRICSKHFQLDFFYKFNNRVYLHKYAKPFADVKNAESTPDGSKDPKDGDFIPQEPKPPRKRRFQCEICDKILSTMQSLKNHKKVHLDPEQRNSFRCEICEVTFKTQGGLKYHLETKHIAGNERNKLPCPSCERTFKSKEGLKIHMTIQHGAEGPIFKCKQCPMVFARKPHLDLHMATHGSGLHVCTICGKSYARLKDLSRHEEYCGVKELCCPVCGKQLRKKQALENHRKKCRTDGRNFRCLTCDQRFATEQALGSHEAIHRETFRCTKCPETFNTVLALQNHEQTKHWDSLEFDSDGGGGGGAAKVRMRRSKYDLFIGLGHLVEPSKLIEKAESNPVVKTSDRLLCEHCPLKFSSKKALRNHGQRRHWEVLGLAEPKLTPKKFRCEHCHCNFCSKQGLLKHGQRWHWKVLGLAEPAHVRRVRCRKRPLERNPKRTRRSQKTVKYVERVDIPEETECDANKEEVDPIKSEDVAHGEPTYNELGENVFINETVEQNDVSVEENNEPIENNGEATSDNILTDEISIKDEIELGEYEFSYCENHSTNDDDNVDDETCEHIMADLEIPQEPTIEEVDALDIEPALETETYVSVEPRISKELVISLERLDYPMLAEPSNNKKSLPRMECDRVREHGSTETPIKMAWKIKRPLRYRCEECDKSYHFECWLKAHNEKVHGIVIAGERTTLARYCKHCGKKFKSWDSLINHIKRFQHGTVDKSQYVKCRSCHERFLNEEERAEHICLKDVDRINERPFKCDLCDKDYPKRHGLECHYAVHPEYHNFKCDQCLKGFFNEKELNRHKENIHKSKAAYIECGTCNQLFKTQQILKRHQEIHSGRVYCCEHCGKKLKSRILLHLHLRFEHTHRAKPCPICGKTITRKADLENHMRIHNNDRRYKCSFPSCDKTFIKNSNFKMHMQTHTKDYKHKCKFCEYGTVFRHKIVKHEQRKHNHNRFAEVNDG